MYLLKHYYCQSLQNHVEENFGDFLWLFILITSLYVNYMTVSSASTVLKKYSIIWIVFLQLGPIKQEPSQDVYNNQGIRCPSYDVIAKNMQYFI